MRRPRGGVRGWGRFAAVLLAWGMGATGALCGGNVSRETQGFFHTLAQAAQFHRQGRPAAVAEQLGPWLERPDTAHRAALLLIELALNPSAVPGAPTGRGAAVVAFQQAYATGCPDALDRLAALVAIDPEYFTWQYSLDSAVTAADRPKWIARLKAARNEAPANPFIPLALAHLKGRIAEFRLPAESGGSLRGRDAAFVLAEILYRINRRARAEALFHQGLDRSRADGDRWRAFECRIQLATHRLGEGDPNGAARFLAEAEQDVRALPLPHLERLLAFAQGYAAVHRGALPEAATRFRSILPPAANGVHNRLQAHALINLGFVLDECGRFEEALACYDRVIPFYTANRDLFSLAMARLDRGAVLERLNLLERARQDYESVLGLPGLPPDSEPRLMAAGNLGNVHARRKRWSEAERQFQEGLAIARASDRSPEAAMLASNLALCLLRQDKLTEARSANHEAANAARQAASPLVALLVDWAEARLEIAAGQPGAALHRLDAMGPTAAAMEERALEWEILYLHGCALAAAGRHAEALDCFDRALTGFRELEIECGDLYMVLHFLENSGDIVESALSSLHALLATGAPPNPLLEKAFALLEANRARVLHRRLAAGTSSRPTPAPGLRQVQSWLQLHSASTLIVFEGEDHLYALAANGGDAALWRVPAATILADIDRLEDSLRRGGLAEEPAPEDTLANHLWPPSPAVPITPDGDLVVLPAGALCRVPLELLPGPEPGARHPLGLQHSVVYLPSWQFLFQATAAAPHDYHHTANYLGLYGFADDVPGTALRWSRQEVAAGAEALAWDQQRIAPAVLLAESQPAEMSDAPWTLIHLATHVEVDEENPWQSRILVAPGQSAPRSLALAEVSSRLGRGNLVILSGCATGRGRVFQGEGAVSLARACLAAGSRAVITTLWPVADRAAAEFMGHFYAALPGCGGHAAPALREARRRMHADPAFRAPVHWAGFVLLGRPDPLPVQSPFIHAGAFFPIAWLALLALWMASAFADIRRRSR